MTVALRCIHCTEQVTPSLHGPVGLHKEITCHQSPTRVHVVPDDVCGFDTDGDGNCAMTLCPACHPEINLSTIRSQGEPIGDPDLHPDGIRNVLDGIFGDKAYRDRQR